MINLLHLTSSSDIGGTERMLVNLLSRIDRARFANVVCSLTGGGELTKRLQAHGFEAHTLNLSHPFQLARVRTLYRLMKSRHFDVIQTYGLRADTIGRILARWAGIPFIISSIRSPDPWRRWYHILIDRATHPLANLFISNSEAGKKSRIEREKYPAEKIRLIYNGIPEPPQFSAEEKAALKKKFGVLDKASPVVAMVANLRIMKGHADVIHALPNLKNLLPDIIFLFAGRDDSSGSMERLAHNLGVTEQIRFLGYQPEPAEILTASDIFLLPSHWEGCPASLLEAMAMGRPCIAANVGGIPEIITDKQNGLLIQPHSPEAITEAVHFLATHHAEASRMGESARAAFLEHFTLERMISEYEELYSMVLILSKIVR
jgi:glycosyltransferase involved in cell wall biosynthesis